MKKQILAFCTALFWFGSLMAQPTGSFDAQINLNGQNRTLSFHVPNSYNPANSYRLLIGLHGLGDNSANYRSALINQRNWASVFPNTIFVFPDGGSDSNRDFYAPAGDEIIIDSAMAYAMRNYSIDSGFVVLQGFSLGGRSAFKYGLENPSQFAGLLLNTPAFQGNRDAENDSAASLIYNYSNAAQLPLHITVGDQDVIYYYTIDNLIPDLKKLNARVQYEVVNGGQHSIPGSAYTQESFPFFADQATADYDLDLFEMATPERSCQANVAPACWVQNKGNATVNSLEINYDLNGNTGSFTWNGTLGHYQSQLITLNPLTAGAGDQPIELSIGAVNGNQSDTVSSNNQGVDTIQVELMGQAIPYGEGFDASFDDWILNDNTVLFGWFRDTDYKRSGQASLAAFNTPLLFVTAKNIESFESPSLDLSAQANPMLSFDVAFNYPQYTEAVAGIDTSFTDTLEILVSTNCGQSWQTLYKKGGANLATAQSPLSNPLTIQACLFEPDSTEWRKDTVDLSAFASNSEAILRFNYISGNGGSIYIDNININGLGLSLEQLRPAELTAYPNPARETLYLNNEHNGIVGVRVIDQTGKVVLHQFYDSSPHEVKVNTSELSAGVYFLKVLDEKGKTSTEKLVIAQ